MTTYITTPIYYVNAQPHLGHAYTTIVADAYSRFSALRGEDVRFQTGTDEHGDKIAEAAEKENIHPQEYVDKISRLFRDTWDFIQITPDNFIRTTDRDHMATVQAILQQVYDNGDIYFDEYSGLYCKGCERFLTEKELVDGKCPDHQVAPQEIAEQNYFFRMSKYQQQLIDHINDNPDFITPVRYKNEVLSFLSEPLEDLCISRPTSRLTWGIELPFDKNFVTYVWFDALINYLTGIGYPDGPDFSRYWESAEHLIAKDILKPHAIYWPTMLMSIGLRPYKKLHVHGYWNVDDTKMSKSIGNVVRPVDLVEEFGIDTLRYFILREMSFGLDASFSSEAIISRANSDLANDLGNLYSRSVAMVQKYCGGVVPRADSREELDILLEETAQEMLVNYKTGMDGFQFHKALQAVWTLISQANKYIVKSEPWTLAKDPSQEKRLHSVLYNLVECLRLLGLVLLPVMPATARNMAKGLGLTGQKELLEDLHAGGKWGLFPVGTHLQAIEPLFPRVVAKKKTENTSNNSKKKQTKKKKNKSKTDTGLVTFEQFKEIDLCVGEIVAASKIRDSDRLLRLTVEVPEKRTIVAGIAEFYSPEEVVGRQVLVVANLKPTTIMGVESQGMLLAAKTKIDGKQSLVLATVCDAVNNGSKVG